MRSNTGKTITIYEIHEFVAHAQLHGLTAKNILSAFQSTGIFPYNRDLFDETDFSPATVTDRDLPEELERNDPIPAEQLPAPQPEPSSTATPVPQPETDSTATPAQQPEPSSTVTPAQQPEPSSTAAPARQPEPSSTATPAPAQPGPRNHYVSPADIVPLPKAGPRKVTNRGRKRGDTKILTDTPVHNSITDALAARHTKKRKSNQPVKHRAKKSFIRK